MWFVGGNFLKESIGYLQVLRKLYDEGRERAAFFDKFDFEFATSDEDNPLSRINTAFYKLYNNNKYLPVLIIYILDEDIFMKPELYLPSEVEIHLRWIFSDFDQALKQWKRAAPTRSFRQGEPQSYVLKAIPRYDVGTDANYLLFEDRLSKYNNMLQAIARCYSIGTVNIQTIQGDDPRLFTESGKTLQSSGHYKLWREVLQTMDQILKDMEDDKRRRSLPNDFRKRSSEHRRRSPDYKRH